MLRVLATCIAVIPALAFACEVAPPEQLSAPEELIARTQNIVLAKVVEARTALDTYEVTYTFESVRTLKGTVTGQFQITGHPGIWEGFNHRFNDHSDQQFWERSVGRSAHGVDCEIHPSFAVGGTYLVFLEKPYHVKGFELIIRTQGAVEARDKWLQYVEKRVVP